MAAGDDGTLAVKIERASGAARASRTRRQAGCGSTVAALRTAAMCVAIFAATIGASRAQARPPPPPPQVSDTSGAAGASADSVLFDLSSRYLRYLGSQGGPGWQGSLFGSGPNPGGGGAPAAPTPPKYRAWSELYGLASQTGPQANFPGDSRRSYGGVAGIAMNFAPGAMLGLSVDQSRSKIDITGLPQHATLDLTQVGINGAYEMGAWTFSAAGVAGFATIDSNRDTLSGPANASYRAGLWGAIAEASYYVPLGSARIVPKFGGDWTQTHASAYSEIGGIDAVTVPSATAERARIFAGAELGNTWVTNATVIDLSWYGRAVDIVSQRVPVLTISAVSGPATPVTVFGVSESKYGFDTGAMASLRLSPIARLYALYDGRFRDGFQSHGGTLGLELRW
jgi:uncharacterized protein with beta-barrel porin domain